MRTLTVPLACALLLAACGDDSIDIASASATDASTGGPTGDPTTAPTMPTSVDPTTTDGDPTAATATSPATATSSPATSQPDPATTDAPETESLSVSISDPLTDPGETTDTTATTDPDTTDTTDTDTGEPFPGCGMVGPEVEALLVQEDVPPPPCGALEFDGILVGPDKGPVYALDGCPCGSNCLVPDPWSLTLDVPDGHLPLMMPECPRIVVERQMSKAGCELVGAAIWDVTAGPEAPPLWIAGSLLGPPAAVSAQLQVEQTTVADCDCGFCCNVPELYDLTFSALGDMTTVPEGGTGSLANNQFSYSVDNFQSHLSGICDDSPDIDWILQLQP